jgi:pyrimidine operon attenuation protein/uracil phosphoribosyltransferase
VVYFFIKGTCLICRTLRIFEFLKQIDLKSILTERQLAITIDRLSHQLIENHLQFENTVIIGLQPRGIYLSDRIHQNLKQLLPNTIIPYGTLDITFYRDDYRIGKGLNVPGETRIPFSLDGKRVILIDDVLYTGRTIRSAMDAMLDRSSIHQTAAYSARLYGPNHRCHHYRKGKSALERA